MFDVTLPSPQFKFLKTFGLSNTMSETLPERGSLCFVTIMRPTGKNKWVIVLAAGDF